MGRLFDIAMAAGEAGRTKDWETLAGYYAADVEAWTPTYEVTGRDALVDQGRAQNDGLDDIRQEGTLVAETGDTVVIEWTWSMPHPSGVGRATLRGMSYTVFDGDQITKVHQYWDNLGFMAQLEAPAGD
jgi:ketosteroid isomerase-like protein